MDINFLLSDWEPFEDEVVDEGGNGSDSADESEEESKGEGVSFISYGTIEQDVDVAEMDSFAMGTAYLKALEKGGGIELLQEDKTRRAFEKKGLMGLFALFFSHKVRSTLLQWITPRLLEKGLPAISMRELNAYIGLEIAASLCPLKRLRDYWSSNEFYGHELFKATMNRDLFLGIRAALTLHPIDSVSEEVKLRDPMWQCRSILNNILKKCVELAVPRGVSAFDESSVRTKARSAARTYLPSKPDKYAVRFYALVDWKTLYVHGLFDNGSGNTSVEGHLERYTALFPQMRRPMATKCSTDDLDPNTATALWTAMLCMQHQQLPSPSGKRIMVMDSFYTRHAFAKHLLSMSAGEIRVIGTCRLNFVDALSRPAVEAAILSLKDAEPGTWKLVAAIDIVGGTMKKAEQEHKKCQKKLKPTQRSPFTPDRFHSPHAGYVVFRDKKVVVFYTNDLSATPTQPVLDGSTVEARSCCNGVAFIQRWTGTEVFRRSRISAPVTVAAYNKYMNAVDRFDQLRSTNPTQRREKRLQMSIFTWLLDLAVHNAFALYQEIADSSAPKKSIRQMKEEIVNTLVAQQQQFLQQLRQKASHPEPIADVVGSDPSLHMLTRSRGKLICLLCSLRGGKNRVKYACTRCKRGFHVECFMALHYSHMMSENTTVMEALDAVISTTSRMPLVKTRNRKNSSIVQPHEIQLPNLLLKDVAPK